MILSTILSFKKLAKLNSQFETTSNLQKRIQEIQEFMLWETFNIIFNPQKNLSIFTGVSVVAVPLTHPEGTLARSTARFFSLFSASARIYGPVAPRILKTHTFSEIPVSPIYFWETGGTTQPKTSQKIPQVCGESFIKTSCQLMLPATPDQGTLRPLSAEIST